MHTCISHIIYPCIYVSMGSTWRVDAARSAALIHLSTHKYFFLLIYPYLSPSISIYVSIYLYLTFLSIYLSNYLHIYIYIYSLQRVGVAPGGWTRRGWWRRSSRRSRSAALSLYIYTYVCMYTYIYIYLFIYIYIYICI